MSIGTSSLRTIGIVLLKNIFSMGNKREGLLSSEFPEKKREGWVFHGKEYYS
jgi:hypothetical protein